VPRCPSVSRAPQEAKLQLAMVMRRHRLAPEVPDMLARCNLFPFITPVRGTDGMRLLPREEPLPWH
jgi:hypothetical protein